MRKFFLLIPALVLALVTNAKVINIAPGTSLAYTINDAEAGDVIVMADGLYPGEDQFHLTKDITIKAADGANPVVQTTYYSELKSGAKVYIEGITFDGSTTSQQCIRVYDATAGKELHLNKCEFKNYPKDVISGDKGEYTLDSCVVNNCYFHNNNYSPIYFNKSSVEGKQTIYGLIVKNSTFANNNPSLEYRSVIDVQSYNREATDDIEVVVDHCTFYNNTTMNYDYSAVRTRIVNKTTVSNCIIAHPSLIEFYATNIYAGNVTNCLAYNLNKGYMSGPTRTNAFTGDPLFTDAANGDYTFPNNWVTMNLSPACANATNGTDLGDPRWYTNPVLPSTDFASGYQFVGEKAQISGNIWYNDVNEFLYFNNKSENGEAAWKITATRACIVEATLNMNAATTSGHKFKVEVFDADGNSIGETAEPSQVSTAGDIVLPNQITLPAAGNYTVKLYNLTAWSSAMIDGITLAYVGGDVQSMPGTTNIGDSWFSAAGTRADGKIDFPDGYIQDGWVKWNVNFANTANYNVTVNIDNANGHNYTVALYANENDLTPVASITEGGQKSTIGTLDLGAMEVPAGNYIMKVTNATQYSDAKLISVNFAYAGGAAVDLSKDAAASLLANADAILSSDWSIEGGKITHAESKALTGWAKWNVNSADFGNYNVTVNISSDNGHGVRVEIFEDEAVAPIYTLDEASATKYHTGDQAIDLGNIVLDAREYVVKVSNTVSSSHVQFASIVITYQNGARATLPATCTFADLMLSAKAQIYNNMLYFETPGDHNPVGQWAKWNVKVDEAGSYLFTMNVTSLNSQSYKISILDGETELAAFESGSLGSGDQTVKHYFNLAAGNYTVKLENTYAWSQGHVVSLAVTQPTLLTIDDTATDNTVIHDNYRNGNHDIQINRTVLGGMYNAICLPFDVNSSQLKAVFGSNVELYEMASATMDGSVLNLQFDAATSIYRSTPYLIKTASNVMNPIFTDVEIKEEEGGATAGTAANFVGTFVQTSIAADGQNLILLSDNRLAFPNDAKTLKGFRAYFHVNTSGASQIIKHARIIAGEQVVTAIDLVDAQNEGVQKVIENGQLFIIKNGVRYNVMGTQIQ